MYMKPCVQFSYNMLFALEKPYTPTPAEMHMYVHLHVSSQYKIAQLYLLYACATFHKHTHTCVHTCPVASEFVLV